MTGEPRGEAIIRQVTTGDLAGIRDLHARAFGPGRFARTAHRVREGTREFTPFCRTCTIDGSLIAAVRFTRILIASKPGALLLGPLAVDPAFANRGYGRNLVAKSLEDASGEGIALVVLVGDEPYYGRLGFRGIPWGKITLPGPVDPTRLLAAELVPDALAGYAGLIAADPAARA